MAHILVVDDSLTLVHFLRTTLERVGHSVEVAESFVALAMLVSTRPPDLILLDLEMPALSGMSVGRLIRKYQSRDIPLIIYSARPEAEIALAGKEIGASAVLSKNGSEVDILNVVRRTLEGSPRSVR